MAAHSATRAHAPQPLWMAVVVSAAPSRHSYSYSYSSAQPPAAAPSSQSYGYGYSYSYSDSDAPRAHAHSPRPPWTPAAVQSRHSIAVAVAIGVAIAVATAEAAAEAAAPSRVGRHPQWCCVGGIDAASILCRHFLHGQAHCLHKCWLCKLSRPGSAPGRGGTEELHHCPCHDGRRLNDCGHVKGNAADGHMSNHRRSQSRRNQPARRGDHGTYLSTRCVRDP